MLPRLPDTRQELIAIARRPQRRPGQVALSRARRQRKGRRKPRSDALSGRRIRDARSDSRRSRRADPTGSGAHRARGLRRRRRRTADRRQDPRAETRRRLGASVGLQYGRGGGRRREAASGLGSAFFYAGTRALLVTNWSVHSASARQLTSDLFRRQSASPGLSRSEALRQSMIALLDGPGAVDAEGRTSYTYAHPLFWAPFTLIGEVAGVERGLDRRRPNRAGRTWAAEGRHAVNSKRLLCPTLGSAGHALASPLSGAARCGVDASAAPPVALVEDVAPQVSGVALMDYLEQGRRLDLGSDGWIEIDYFSSCLHERIVGGSVTVGAERSDVSGGAVERHQVECDAGKIVLTEPQAERAAGFVQRGGAELKNRIHAMTNAQLVLHGASPLVIGDGAHDVVITRFGNSRDRVTLPVGLRRRAPGVRLCHPRPVADPRRRLHRDLRRPAGDVSHRSGRATGANSGARTPRRFSARAMTLCRSQ